MSSRDSGIFRSIFGNSKTRKAFQDAADEALETARSRNRTDAAVEDSLQNHVHHSKDDDAADHE